ncbi:helix-turn-helix transcriptional regulator [Actinoplanes solisilvae]|uniref:helix-turn-helix transcriptional regulator n=1 Tax=Actinoplanes solisilvae TaxID=2486853 RepID=UPI0013E38F1E|nr:LuxR family transcriptional regulator [Actinoplanes solisilvae]
MHEVSPVGRDAELAVIHALLAAARQGHGGALVIAGGYGEGRSSLLRAVAAAGMRPVVVPGHEDEAGLALGGLQRLLEPLAAHVDRLPAAQRAPLIDVLAGRESPAGPLMLGVSTLALLRLAAADGPMLIVVDDADRLDPPSWLLFRLLARRLAGLPVVLLAAVATSARGHAAASGLPLLRLTALDEDAGHRLLAARAPDLTPDVAAALVELAAGHPAALVDLVTTLTPEQRRGLAPAPTALPADSTLRLRGRAALESLPPRTRHLLLLAATDPQAHPGDLLDASGDRATLGDLEPAERAGLIAVSAAGVRFTPAVLRSVVHDEAPIGQRHRAHELLAGVLGDRGHRLRSLLHRAALVPGHDDELARELLEASESAPAREAFEGRRRAAGLSSDPVASAGALLAAARSAMAAGRPRDARPLLQRASRLRGSAVVRSRARGLIAEMRVRRAPAESRDVLLDVAAELLPTDPAGTLDALLVAGEACGRTGEPGRYPALARQAAARWPLGGTGHAMALHQVVGVADLMSGADDAAFGHLREVLRLAEHVTDPVALVRAANTGILLGQGERAARLGHRAAASARTRGNAFMVPEALESAAFAEMAAGRYDEATEAALDGLAVARGAGRPELADAHLALLALLAALAGDRETGRERIDTLGHVAGEIRALSDWAEALLDLVDGRPEAAAGRLLRIAGGDGSMTLRVAIAPHLVEATGAGGEAFDRWAGRTGQPGWLALRSRCRALTETEAADEHFREALGWHARAAEPGFARAHTELLYGRHLRRRRRPAEAREHLRRSAATFHRLDARPWAEQAARELRAAGERIGPVDRAPLTAQQERIAGLVAEGATNREVAQQLHLSPRTIDHHLRNVFARLGVRSRTELARLLA